MADGSDVPAKLEDLGRDLRSLRDDLQKLPAAGLGFASGKVQEQPFAALLVAFSAGLVCSLLRR